MNSPDSTQPSAAPSQGRCQVVLPDGTERLPLGSGEITAKLGEGGMAAVYEIWNAQLEVYHAVKLINPSCSHDSLDRFQTEIKITAKLHHPNITEIHAVGMWNGLPYIEMEKLEGTGLDAIISTAGALPVSVCTAIAIMITRALDHAHNHAYQLYGKTYHGIIHRDLKPGNIMICSTGEVKLMDFGVARPAEASFHTMDGQVVGTLQYLSPEQLSGREIDIRTDIYALGATLYEMLCGIPAFPEKVLPKLIGDKSSNRYKPLETYRAHVPSQLRAIVRRCMHHDPARRVQDAGSLIHELEKIHRSVTALSPEEVMKRFVAKSQAGKRVLRERFILPVKAIAAGSAAVAAALAAALYLPPYLENLKKSRAPAEPQRIVIRDTVRLTTQPDPKAGPARPALPKKPAPRAAPAVARPAPAVATAVPAPGPKPVSLLASLLEKYGTDDPVAVIAAEWQARNFKNAVEIFESLPADRKSDPKAIIYTMRSLEGLGGGKPLQSFLSKYPVEDGEYYLARAKSAWNAKDVAETGQFLDQSLSSQRRFIDYGRLKQETSYYKALCASFKFDANPSAEAAWKEATGAWFEVKSEMKNDRQHMYYIKAEQEIRRIGEKYRENKK